jgi:L-ascorbate metabolism protein UlaG (beta-lactamase superfamily)
MKSAIFVTRQNALLMEITYYGHSCFSISTAGKNLLFDPFISGNELAKDVNIKEIKADYILLSHAHFDHVLDVESIQKQTGATIVSNWEIVTYYGKKGLPGHPMNIGGAWQFDFGKVEMTSAIHSSSFGDGTYGGSPAGFIISSTDKTIYYSGDTALHFNMKLIAEKYKLDAALLCIGDNFTMGPEDALLAAKWVGANKIIAMHYDTFPYIVIDKEETKKAALATGIQLLFLNIGTSIKL